MFTPPPPGSNAPLVSVIVPVYNVGGCVRRALESLGNQTYQNLEIICVDDGSTDGSAAILREFAERDARIQVITQPNGGVSAARNAALAQASGEWVTGLDADDYLRPEAIATAVAHAADEVDLVCLGRGTEAEPGSGLEGQVEASRQWARCPFEGLRELDDECLTALRWNFCTKFYRLSLIRQHGLAFDEACFVSEDLDFHMRYCAYARRAWLEPQELYVYCLRASSAMQTREGQERRLQSQLQAFGNIARVYQQLGTLQEHGRLFAFLFRVIHRYVSYGAERMGQGMNWRGRLYGLVCMYHLQELEEVAAAMRTADMVGLPVALMPGGAGSDAEVGEGQVRSAVMLMDLGLMREWMHAQTLSEKQLSQLRSQPLTPRQIKQVLSEPLTPRQVKQVLSEPLTPRHVKQVLSEPLTPRHVKQVLSEPLTPRHIKQVLSEPLTPRHVKQVLSEPLTPRHVKQVLSEPLTAAHTQQVRDMVLGQEVVSSLRGRMAAMEEAERCGVVHLRVLGFLPLLKIERRPGRDTMKLFHFLPLLTRRYRKDTTRYYLFGFLPLLRLRSLPQG